MKISNKVYPVVQYENSILTVFTVATNKQWKPSFGCVNDVNELCSLTLNDPDYKLVSPYDKHTLDLWVQQQTGVTLYKTRRGVTEIQVGMYPLQESELKGVEEFPKLLSNGEWVYWRDLVFKEPLPLSTLLRDEWALPEGTDG